MYNSTITIQYSLKYYGVQFSVLGNNELKIKAMLCFERS